MNVLTTDHKNVRSNPTKNDRAVTIVWGSTYKSYLQKPVSSQNKGLR